jgi:hypothetical protein
MMRQIHVQAEGKNREIRKLLASLGFQVGVDDGSLPCVLVLSRHLGVLLPKGP